MTIRTTLARLVMNFDIRFPPTDGGKGGGDGDGDGGDRGKTFEARSTEHFTLHPAELEMLFVKRG